MNRDRVVDMNWMLKRLAPRAEALIEGRIAQLRFPDAPSRGSRASLLNALASQDGVALAAAREGDSVYVVRRGGTERIDYFPGSCGAHAYKIRVVDLQQGQPRFFRDFACPSEFDRLDDGGDPGDAAAGLVNFFQADTRPDAFVVAAPGVAFIRGARGHHGGLTREEMIVPLLARNAKIASPGKLFSNTGLLEFLLEGPELPAPASAPPSAASKSPEGTASKYPRGALASQDAPIGR